MYCVLYYGSGTADHKIAIGQPAVAARRK